MKGIAVGFVLVASVISMFAEGRDPEKRYCRNIDGDVIIVAAPALCPPGYWEI